MVSSEQETVSIVFRAELIAVVGPPSVRVTRGAGSGQHLASVLQGGRENANIDAGKGGPKARPVRTWEEKRAL